MSVTNSGDKFIFVTNIPFVYSDLNHCLGLFVVLPGLHSKVGGPLKTQSKSIIDLGR